MSPHAEVDTEDGSGDSDGTADVLVTRLAFHLGLVMLCYVMLCYVMLCYVMLCCDVLCYVMLL